jgi:ATP-dependent exoDNAse (exonuclease V) beta subunit
MTTQQPILYPVLEKRNAHPRDEHIRFQEEGHKYTILIDPDSIYTSVTTWNHSHFPHFDADEVIRKMMQGRNWNPDNKYWGLTPDQIKKQWSDNGASVSSLGTQLHYEIECFMNQPLLQDTDAKSYTHLALYKKNHSKNKSPEWQHFLEYVIDHPDFRPYRTEWTIFDEELKLAGSIDMVYEHPEDGSLSIYDWKRSKEISKVNRFDKFAVTPEISHLPDSNFWHYALQLNTYKAILERKYGKRIRDLCLVRLYPNEDGTTYELIDVPDLQDDIRSLFDQRRNDITLKA